MKKTLIILLVSLSFNISAADFIITGACSKTPFLEIDIDITKYETLGDLTISLLNKNKLQYQGNERAINQINYSPLGLDALDVASDTVMYAYGWCYSVNDKVLDVFAEDVYLNESITKIHWFYGYSEFKVDRWVSMCVLPETRDNSFICQK